MAELLTVRVARKTVAVDGIAGFEFVATDGSGLPASHAGAHIDVHAPGAGCRAGARCAPPRRTPALRDRHAVQPGQPRRLGGQIISTCHDEASWRTLRQSALMRVHSGRGSSPCSTRPRSRGRTSPSHWRSRTPRPAHAAPSWSRRPSRRAWRSTSAYRSCGPNSCFTSRSVACMRSRRVRRWSWKAPRRDRPQMRRTPRS